MSGKWSIFGLIKVAFVWNRCLCCFRCLCQSKWWNLAPFMTLVFDYNQAKETKKSRINLIKLDRCDRRTPLKWLIRSMLVDNRSTRNKRITLDHFHSNATSRDCSKFQFARYLIACKEKSISIVLLSLTAMKGWNLLACISQHHSRERKFPTTFANVIG